MVEKINGSICENVTDVNKCKGVGEGKTTFEDALEVIDHYTLHLPEERSDIYRVGRYNYTLLAIVTYSLLAATAEMFTIGLVTTSAQCDLDLDVRKRGLLSSLPILGVVVSAHFWGFLADTQGRRFALIISSSACCCAGLLAAFASNWIFLAVIKFIGAIFASGTNAISFTILGETTGLQKRQLYLMYAAGGVLAFHLFNAILAYPILSMTFSYDMPLLGYTFRPWRLYLLAIAAVSGINILLIVFFMLESPKFYFAIGEHADGLRIMKKFYKLNTGNAMENYPFKHVVLNKDDYKAKQRNFFRSIWEQTLPLFSKKYIKTTFLIFLCGLPAYCISPPLSIWLPFIMNSVNNSQDSNIQFCDIFRINNTVSSTSDSYNISEIPECDDRVSDLTFITLCIFAIYLVACSVVTVLLLKCIGKKWTFVANHLVCSILCVLINYLDMIGGVITMVMMSLNVTCMGIVTTYAIELFPTYMRAMAVCLTILSGRAVSMVFFQVVGSQLQTNCFNFIYIMASLILFGAIAGLFLPSDRKKTEAVKEKAKENKTSYTS